MKNITKIFAIALVALGFSATSFAQTSATSTSLASGTVLKALTINNTTPLNFGTFGSTTSAKTVVLGLDDTRTASTATLYSIGAPAKTGVFALEGTPSATFTVTLPTASVTTLTGPGGATMTILATSWNHDLGITPTMAADGTQTLKVGATLNVGAGQAAGTYSGNYDVTIAYN